MNTVTLPATRQRIYSLDILRGLVMIIMALDHVRDFFHFDAFVHDPLDLNTTSPALFFTRWITHFCAPVFVFLAGTSAFLQTGKKSKKEVSSLLLKRGLWLIFIEVTVITFAWTFDPGFHLIAAQVIWAIGFSMVMLGVLVWLPFTAIFATGLVITLGHNVLDFAPALQTGNQSVWVDLFLKGKFTLHEFSPGRYLMTVYAGIPWLGLMLLGYCFGSLYSMKVDASRRKKWLLYLGIASLLLFVLLRWTNMYGDPQLWSNQKNPLYTFLSFINTTKYPPSLLYICLFIGPSLLLLAALEKTNNPLSRAVSVFGRVPFFYYVIHLYLIHGIEMIAYLIRHHGDSSMPDGNMSPFKFHAAGEGYSLALVYVIWLVLVLALYPLCKWFNDYKNRKRVWWMSYL